MARLSLPIPTVSRSIGRRRRLRKARGFSLGELKEAGLHQYQARSLGIRTDERRSTVHSHNVTALKGFLSLPKTSATPSEAEHVPEESELKKEVVSGERKKVRRYRTTRAKKRKT